jgi:uncharacterized protein (DUF342 family)
MATTVYETKDIVLQDGTEVTLKPLNIKRQRLFMKRFNQGVVKVRETVEAIKKAAEEEQESQAMKLQEKQEQEWLDTLIACAVVCLASEIEQFRGTPKDATEHAEEVLDTQTISEVLKVCAGVNLEADMTNLVAAAVTETTGTD